MRTIILILSIVSLIGTIIYVANQFIKERIYLRCDSYGAINVFDEDGELVVLLYKDRTIEYRMDKSFFVISKIKMVSNHFEKYSYIIMQEGGLLCL